ncbi:PFGI-1 class ICE element type IV pilus protein PilL2 [Chitinimonas lacunae]|uniref:PilL N-terminal domain-containing protein n=1 Tax=Chitinimonas lacunae TaxID=1963018 RepID=A0ABV8MSU6_9NEIS
MLPFPLQVFCLCLSGAVLTGCATQPAVLPDATRPLVTDVIPTAVASSVSVVRQGRYTLVELVPEPFQRDLLAQVVTMSIPVDVDATVGDALRHALARTGYGLCEAADAAPLYRLPLPAAHLTLGPLTLRDALLTLAGPAWTMSVDDVSRTVCFRQRDLPSPDPGTAERIPEGGHP